MLIKKDTQCESFKLSFIVGKMRTIVWEIAFQIALRNCAHTEETQGAMAENKSQMDLNTAEY